jgi:phosphoribosylglycinamide formyltransferase
MHVLSERFLSILDGTTRLPDSEYPEEYKIPPNGVPVINLHPALPGAFDGANAIERAYEAWKEGKITETGVMVHRVIKEVDRGEPILTRIIPFVEGESLEEFEKRLHAVEWGVIVDATKKIVDELGSG